MLQTIYELGERLSITESLGLSSWLYPETASGRAADRVKILLDMEKAGQR